MECAMNTSRTTRESSRALREALAPYLDIPACAAWLPTATTCALRSTMVSSRLMSRRAIS
jgi:hypothetical protein